MNRLAGPTRADRWRFLKGCLSAHAAEAKQPKLAAREILRRTEVQAKVDADRAEDRCVAENRDFGAFAIGEVSGHYLKARAERTTAGLTADELRSLAEGKPANGAYREEAAEEAIEGWRIAHRRAREGGAAPLAVLVRRGERRGRIIYRN